MPDPNSADKKPGLICTFYSYKGGVGRSMALANVGVVMATQGHRVLLIDWDLEAPGLEEYFRAAAKLDGNPAENPGLLDLIEAHSQGKPMQWEKCLMRSEFLGSSLDILSAGRRSEDYGRRVQQLNWKTLFSRHRIGNYFDALREEWISSYDYILIDSRTGITDIGDICTVLLPDVLVLLFVTNRQNIAGVKSVMERAVRVRAKLPINRSKLLAVPLPARDERHHEYNRSLEWQNIFAHEFSDLYREWLPGKPARVEPTDALNQLYIPYVAEWSFGERIPVLESERERTDPTSLGAAYTRLAALLIARLDWSALSANASPADLAAAQLEVASAREAAREAEEARRKAEEALRVTIDQEAQVQSHITLERSNRVDHPPRTGKKRPLRVFLSYSREDKKAHRLFRQNLLALESDGYITFWDETIQAGMEWRSEIDRELEAMDVFVGLLTTNFHTSRFIQRVELETALQRRATKPELWLVLVEDRRIQGTPYEKCRLIRPGGKAVSQHKGGLRGGFDAVEKEIFALVEALWAAQPDLEQTRDEPGDL